MRLVLVLFLPLIPIVVVAVVLARRSSAGQGGSTTHAVADAERDAEAWPSPGDPAPRRDGEPMPGSEPDRHRHGKP